MNQPRKYLLISHNGANLGGAAISEAVCGLIEDQRQYEDLRRAGWEWSREITFERSCKDFVNYSKATTAEKSDQLGPIRQSYLRNWKKFLNHPVRAIIFLGYNACKFSAGGVGYFIGNLG